MQKKDNRKVLLRIANLKQYFPLKKSGFGGEQLYVKANDGISLNIYEGETFGLVGESGCGKSTFGRVLLQLYHQTDGKTMYYGRTLHEVAPQYVEHVLKNAEKQREQLKELQKKEDQLRSEFDALNERVEKEKPEEGSALLREFYARQRELSAASKETHDLFLDLTQILGGFMSLQDITAPCQAMQKEFAAARIVRDLNQKKQKLQSSLISVQADVDAGKNSAAGKKQKLETSLKEIEEQIRQKQKDVDSASREVEKLRKPHMQKEEYKKYEAYRDNGVDLARLNYDEMRSLRRDLQLIFQDPYSSLNPRMTVGQIIGEGLRSHNIYQKDDAKMQEFVMQVMQECGLAPYMIHRYPHQFSGGQRQRIGIARSLALRPRFVVCDEAVSALDVSIQSQVINLLLDLKEQEHLTYLFISHDLSVVKYISDRIGVMYLGNIVELADSAEIFRGPIHPYTEALLSAIPTTDVDHKSETILLEGDIPSPIKPPSGCKFHTRCRYCTDVCKEITPELVEMAPGHFAACHHPLGREDEKTASSNGKE